MRRIDAIARFGWHLTLFAIVFGLAAGWVTVTTGIGGERGAWPSPDYRPPLFFVIANGLYALALLATVPGSLAALPALARRRFAVGSFRLIAMASVAAIYYVFVKGSHMIGCTVEILCREGSFTGANHLFHHTAVAVPIAAALAALRWWLGSKVAASTNR